MPDGRVMTCFMCREQYAENDRPVPCDIGGIEACLYWKSHEASPGALHLTDRNHLAIYLRHRIDLLGWPTVDRLFPWETVESEDREYVLEALYTMKELEAEKQAAAEKAEQEYAEALARERQHA